MSSCCDHDHATSRRPDYLLWGSVAVIVAGIAIPYLLGIAGIGTGPVSMLGHNMMEIILTMWWGVLAGIVFVGLMGQIPKEYFSAILGRGDSVGGVFRAAMAGVLLDLCSHGILMVGAKLYERGASLAQVMAFLIASPWNSFSLTFILIALVGFKLTLVFIALSALIAIVTGLLYLALTRARWLPDNPHAVEASPGFDILDDARSRMKHLQLGKDFWLKVFSEGWHDARMVLRWVLFGIALSAMIKTFIPTAVFASWYGPTLAGLLLTLVTTTLIEVCSEGATPIAADLVTRAQAPGNGFAFLMAGVSTDYTEIMVLKSMTGSWKIALSLPLLTMPQILALGWVLNHF